MLPHHSYTYAFTLLILHALVVPFPMLAECDVHPACADGRGHCRSSCNEWEEETGFCGFSCKCCVSLTEGKALFVSRFFLPDNIHHCMKSIGRKRYLFDDE